VSYVDESLTKGEEVVFRGRVHPVIYGWAIFWAALALVTRGITLIIALPLAIFAWVYASTTEMAVTNRKIVGKWGFLRKTTIEQRLARVDSVTVRQGIIGSMLNFGSVVVRGSGESLTPVRFVADPVGFKRAVDRAIEEDRAPSPRANSTSGN
jgi:hypothetical protein